jgi:GAF domain-containing protein
MWEEDFSEVKAELDKLRGEGVTDFRGYINEHPELLERCVQLVKILDVNKAMLKLYEAKDKSEILGSLDQLVPPENFREELIAFAEGASIFERDIYSETLQGKQIYSLMTVTYYSDTTGKQMALVNETDITNRKIADEYLKSQNEYLGILNEMTRVILLSTDYDATLNALAGGLKKIINADDCYILYWNEEKAVPVPVATTAKLDFNFLETEFDNSDEFITNRVFLTGRALAVEDIGNSPYISKKIADQYPARSVLGIPLITGNLKLGIAVIAFNTLHQFTPREIEYAEQAGNQVALALWNFQQSLEIQHRLKESNALARIGRALSETERVGTDKVLQLIVDSARELIEQVDESVIHIIDPEEQTLVPRAISGFSAGTKAYERSKMHMGEGVAGKVMKTGETIKIGDITRSELFVKKDTPYTFLSLLVAPIRSAGREIGTISVQSKRADAFSQQDVDLLNALSVQATIAIENTRLFEATQQSLKEVNALYRISQGLASSLDSDELIEDVVDLLYENFGYYHVQIYLLDPSGNNFIIKKGSGEIGKKLMKQKFQLPVGTGITGHVAETQTPFVTNNVNEVVVFYYNPLLPHTQSELAVPIKVDGAVVGVIDIHDKHPNKLTDNDLQLVVAVADQL